LSAVKNVVAFVAKSFLPEDSEVVAEIENFLKQFEQRGLRCIDASQGKEGSLSAKVADRLDDAQAFIGILTRRHHVLRPKSVTRKALSIIQRLTSPLEWATSSWTLQESGFAVAREFKLILIVEDGVSDIGQLHGDPVIVKFSRVNVSACFAELAGQLMSLLIEKPATSEVSPSESDAAEEPPTSPTTPQPRAGPTPMWDKFLALHSALLEESPRTGEAEEAYREAMGLAEDDDDRDLVEMTYLKLRLEAGLPGAFEVFRERSDNHPTMRGLTLLGRYVASSGEHQRALELFERAMAAPALGFSRSVVLADRSRSLHALGKKAEARMVLLDDLRSGALSESDQASLAVALADLAKRDSAGEDEAAWLEHSLSLLPDDHDVRFRLAYLYSALGNNQLALFHYQKLSVMKPSDAALNNLGVSRIGLDLPSLGVAAFKRSSEMRYSLAMANRAARLMDQGFLREAEAVLDESIGIEDPHENIASIRAQIVAKLRSEEEKEQSILSEAETERQFQALFGRARLVVGPDHRTLVGVWRTDWGNITAVVEGHKITGRGETVGTARDLHETFYEVALVRVGSPDYRLRRVVMLDGVVEGNSGTGVLSKRLYIEGGTNPLQEIALNVRFATDGIHVQVLEIDEKEKKRQVKRYQVDQAGPGKGAVVS
jgi:tetratricopeptide (TPR) repeat protein